jgi:predicted Rossmann fold flavoprotein
MSGAGQCNLTHGGGIKDFIGRYGDNGTKIRSVLYQFSNQSVMKFFEEHGIPLLEREDGKVFPRSLKAQDILQVLTDCCKNNGLQFQYDSEIIQIKQENTSAEASATYLIQSNQRSYRTRKLIISTGGCSYPVTGSDGKIFSLLESLGYRIEPLSPALVPVRVRQFPYKELSGISFQHAEVMISSEGMPSKKAALNKDALLLTHTGFSGPAVLNLSRYAHAGDSIQFDYYPEKSAKDLIKELTAETNGNKKQLITVLYEYFNNQQTSSYAEIPKRFLETICFRAGADTSEKASRVSPSSLKAVVDLIKGDTYIIEALGGYETAMVTRGGVSLEEVNLKTMEAKKLPKLYFAGEVLDIDGDTGGYNLQFAFSSGSLAAKQIV